MRCNTCRKPDDPSEGEAGDAPEWLRRHARIAEQVNALLWDDEDQFYYDLDEQGAFVPVKTTAGLMPLLAGFPDGASDMMSATWFSSTYDADE